MKKLSLASILLIALSLVSFKPAHSQSDIKPLPKNRISLGVLDMAFGDIGLKYERLIGNGKAGVFVPLTLNYYQAGMYDYDNKFYSGLGLNYYPTGQGEWRYYTGVEMNVGVATFYHSYNHFDPSTGYYQWGQTTYEGVYSRFLINNGIMYSPTPEFSVDFHLGLGFRNAFVNELTKDEKINPNAALGLNLSYKF